jgi:hypothetical protein
MGEVGDERLSTTRHDVANHRSTTRTFHLCQGAIPHRTRHVFVLRRASIDADYPDLELVLYLIAIL